MKYLIFFLLTVVISISYGFIDFEPGHEYKFKFVGKIKASIKTVGVDPKTQQSKYSGIINIKKTEDPWLYCQISDVSVEPESVRMKEDLLKPFMLKGENFAVSDFRDADGVDEEVTYLKKKLMQYMLYDYSHLKRLFTEELPHENISVQVPKLDLCKISYNTNVENDKRYLLIDAVSTNCKQFFGPKITGSKLQMVLTYDLNDNSQKDLMLSYESKRDVSPVKLKTTKYSLTLVLMGSEVFDS